MLRCKNGWHWSDNKYQITLERAIKDKPILLQAHTLRFRDLIHSIYDVITNYARMRTTHLLRDIFISFIRIRTRANTIIISILAAARRSSSNRGTVSITRQSDRCLFIHNRQEGGSFSAKLCINALHLRSKTSTLTKCCPNAGPPSATLAQRKPALGQCVVFSRWRRCLSR